MDENDELNNNADYYKTNKKIRNFMAKKKLHSLISQHNILSFMSKRSALGHIYHHTTTEQSRMALKHLFRNTHLFLSTCQAASISAYRFFSDGFPVLTP